MSRVAIKRALISVYDKTGLEELARGLHEAGVEIVSTGSTAGRISSAGVPVMRVEKLTGFPECLDGRVKTLHPKVHAGLLADRRKADHLQQLDDLAVEPFDLVVANLYPFADTVDSGAEPDECVEQIDIGGPTMVRAAAKNHASVSVIVDPSAYGTVLDAVKGGGFTLEERRRLAARAFAHTASYDVAVASWFASSYAPDETAAEAQWPDFIGVTWERANVLRYGENPHQRAALYLSSPLTGARPRPHTDASGGGLAGAEQLHGKEMSYNNYVDADAARRAAHDFTEPAVAIIKHANPCGIAVGADVAEAHRRAHACDPLSAFGGVIAVNRPVTVAMAEQVAEIFTEVLVAPAFEDGALEVLTRKKNIRLLRCPQGPANAAEYRRIDGGVLLQEVDRVDAGGDDPSTWELKAGAAADEGTLADLAFAWRAVRSVKSNAILLAADGATVGVGMGQVNRVDSAKLAVARAGAERAASAVGASDAFFPFPDGLEVLAEAGVRAVVEPGGSVNDDKVIAAAEKAGISLYFTGVRHFFH
ncbi:bifunctional phosphoribosylaminoimidazolecarboxamide formyltransferase/IMP cyclohydrolase [Actinomadura sp. 3N407]|uniref:bifunctional phosphoribosylaminoimidazolecarboxamide formyltransferase/IMP cyclohydrolase n=1 Tax=Actinomadura sp. 3N407 TaxID=3457423 RepID=UPI003FCECDC9